MRHNLFRYLLAAVLIGIGVLLILENVGVATFDARSYWINLYPLLFIVYGLKTIIDRIRYRGGSWIFGSFLLIFGTLLMLDRFGVFTFEFKDIFKLWPLLIIYLGFTFIRPNRMYHSHTTTENKGKNGYYYGPYDYTKHYDRDGYKKYAKDQVEKHVKDHVNYYTDRYKDKYNRDVVYDATDENKTDPTDEGNTDDTNEGNGRDGKSGADNGSSNQDDWRTRGNANKTNHSSKRKGKSYSRGSFFSIGDIEYSKDNWKVEPMRLSNLAGDFYLDFTKAFIPEKEIPISISALAGDVRILMPENVEFRVAVDVKAGDIKVLEEIADGINRSLYFETDHYQEATRKLDLTVKLKAGSVRIDHV